MKITLIFVIGKYSDTSSNAGRGSVGGFLQLFAAPAARSAGVIRLKLIRFLWVKFSSCGGGFYWAVSGAFALPN